jgi:hypothetical protein
MSTASEADVVAKAIGLKVRCFLNDYWQQIVQAGQDHEQGMAKITIGINVSTVHPNTPHTVTVTIPLGRIRETRVIEQDELESPDGLADSDDTEVDRIPALTKIQNREVEDEEIP